MSRLIPFIKPCIAASDIDACTKSLKSGWLAYGQYTEQAEISLQKFFQADNFTMTSSCTASLQMALIMSGVKRGDEVITTPLTWVASANVILYTGATVVFADVDIATGLIDAEKILEKITKNTKAIIVVDLYGQMFDVQALRNKLPRNDIVIIQDAAHSIGAKMNGVPPGTAADYTCFSFHAAKNITSGQGGGLICRNKDDVVHARLLRRDGVVGRNHERTMIDLGYKFDSTDFQSALLLGQIERYEATHAKRKRVYENYSKLFNEQKWSREQTILPHVEHSYHMYVMWLNDSEIRNSLVMHLNEQGTQVSVHYNPVHLEPYYKTQFGYREGMYPNAESIGRSAISLPTYPDLHRDDQQRIFNQITEFLTKS